MFKMEAFAHAFAKEKAENRHWSSTGPIQCSVFFPNPNLDISPISWRPRLAVGLRGLGVVELLKGSVISPTGVVEGALSREGLALVPFSLAVLTEDVGFTAEAGQEGILAEAVVIDKVRLTQGQAVEALAEELEQFVFDIVLER